LTIGGTTNSKVFLKIVRPMFGFFESPQGLAFLHQLLCALHLVVGQANDGGIRNICWLLELCELDRFVATSYGAQHAVAVNIEIAIQQFGQQERARLAKQMSHRDITLCEDETFHPQICLVAIEAVSNYLILQEYAAKRDAATWNAAISEALQPLSVTVTQCVSDQATALISHAQTYLGVHHSPDLFHVQQEASRATSLPLARQTENAQKTLDTANATHQLVAQQLEEFNGNWPNSIKQLELEQKLQRELPIIEEALNIARKDFETVQARQHRARDARKGIGQDYHPFDLKTGATREATEVESSLKARFDTLDQIAAEANLKPSSMARLAKAKRVLPSMIETVVFFWKLIAIRAAALAHSPAIVDAWKNQLVASYYLAAAANRCSDSKERKRLRELSRSILTQAKARDGPLSGLSESEVSQLEAQAKSAAELFQRSSSCVEGRNGQLSLRHHGLREITARKLEVLGVLHNFVIKRSDGSTAASRFFGQQHRSLFPWLVENLPLPSRPRKRRNVSA
jgi:hypothetical protein